MIRDGLEYVRTVMERCDVLGTYSEEPERLTRRFGTEAMRQASDKVAVWMREAGMEVRRDNIGNLIGRYQASPSEAPTLLLGSHFDTVRGAGKYDGPLGVLVALACVQRLRDRNERLPYAIEVLAFADEEGMRFGATYYGSQVVAGTFDAAELHRTDEDGITLADAIRAFGGDPEALHADKWAGGDLLGYCEVHIEQGPVLESRNLPVCVVSAIAGQSRFIVRFTGEAGHAGTVPMELRRDALGAAAEFVLAVEAEAQATAGLVATVGQLSVRPGATNVIPAEVAASLDIRHQQDSVRAESIGRLQERVREIGERRQVATAWQQLRESQATPCAPHLTGLFEQAISELDYPAVYLPSGAGHDAVAMADLTDVAMLFVRCRGGISHNPAESVTTEDVAVAVEVLSRTLELLGQERAISSGSAAG